MSAYVQRCVLCGSDGKELAMRECKWCGGNGIKGNGTAEQSSGQLTHRIAAMGLSATTPLTPARAINGGFQVKILDLEVA